MSDPRLATLPALRKLAEEEARERMELFHRQNPPPNPGAQLPVWADLSRSYREELAAVELALLSDLTRPASRDALVRIIDLHGDANDRDLARHARDDEAALTILALHVLGSPDADR